MKPGEFKFHGKRGVLAWTPKSTPELAMNFNRASNDPASQVVSFHALLCSALLDSLLTQRLCGQSSWLYRRD